MRWIQVFRSIGGDRGELVIVLEIPGALHCHRAECKRARDSNCPVLLLCALSVGPSRSHRKPRAFSLITGLWRQSRNYLP